MSSQIMWSNNRIAYRSRRLIWLCAALVMAIVVWASWATLDEVVVGDGKVVPSLSIQTIQSLEGGIIKQVLVSQGEQVVKGQPLMVLDDTRFRASYQESDQQLQTLLAQKKRLELELQSIVVDSRSTDWQQQVRIAKQPYPSGQDEVTRAEFNARENYHQRLEQLDSELEESALRIEQQSQAYQDTLNSIRTLENSMAIVQKELNMLEDVVKTGAVAEVELLKLKRDYVKLQGDISSAKVLAQKQKAAYSESIADYRGIALDFRTKARGQLNEVVAELARLQESQSAIADQLRRTEILSPVDGTVKDVLIRSIGGVVRPGEPIMELVPLDSRLIVEARIAPQDIAYVKVGLEATVKFTAYDFVIYGGQKGKVVYVSADSLKTEEGDPYYRAHIELMADDASQQNFRIIPGMQAMVDILSGEKTVLSYWLKPLLRAKETALREP
ncbi:TPA: HlyD family type I secretion periplasmic adaptor subunit [Vibrio vulnificus]|uniref:Membrane fusion protein (MFP) family protein n=1 Tax=Vibrio vulnificus TaxID=672 RepID=A0A8H9MWP4_VIBVL|nr:HlyD family type I secretion periplasmic adaptor subunit [Vibrio vulnificus]EGQ9932467.1 HlyD family type I secretion periplasmic adaptor subunit [Vibrio vulnificus]EHD2241023.1 HlyD family type I secretion periplasmic adaptor subunit [Vibrio vulnificus]EID0061600.1 HlyD family type I secretion periplasmic adaptor subunit [Vibrio vulnificus]EID0063166.1 HlyD family type I secretion periplasmic adaptor subunit [Vibrio vulnificus]EID0717093.1 HlyD family type I secretion periplasmic adaptor s